MTADILKFPAPNGKRVEVPCDTKTADETQVNVDSVGGVVPVDGPSVWVCVSCGCFEHLLHADGWVQCGNEDCSLFFEGISVTFGDNK